MLEISDGNQAINEFNYHQSHVFLCHKTSHSTMDRNKSCHTTRLTRKTHCSPLIVT